MPALHTFLRPESITGADGDRSENKKNQGGAEETMDAEEKRKRELERLLGEKKKEPAGGKERTGMEWGSVSVFSCLEGCGGEWGEEWVGVEFEEDS
jgi:hypothetical protein